MPRRLKTLLTSILVLSLFLIFWNFTPPSPNRQAADPPESPQVQTYFHLPGGAGSPPETSFETPTSKNKQAQVTRIIDGDTIELENGTKIRYIGINTPEKDRCFGTEATKHNSELVEGKTIQYETDVQTLDRYGRTLAYVWVGDIFINDQLVLDGYAEAATYPPNIKHVTRFTESEREARENNVGLWASNAC
jgi:micrococcal nuclease